MSIKIWSITRRFLKGMIAGAMGAMALIAIKVPTTWSDFPQIFNAIGVAAAFGSTTGFLLACQKWASWKDEI